jgi:serine/threonine-protein kinase
MVAQIAYALLEVLAHAHAKGVVHLDIKPENLFITRDGELRVFDFGVGRLLEPHGADGTRIGRALGTPAFMPPEQALGRFRGVDPRADLWAVGATMWRLLTGRYVHDGGTASEQLLYAATRRAPRMVDVAPEVPTALADVIDRALEFDRERRWPSATEMREALAEAYAACFELDLDAGEMEPAPPTSRAADGLLDVRDLPTWQSESPTGVV